MKPSRSAALLLSFAAALLLSACAARYDGPATAHFDGRHFRNEHPQETAGLLGILKWKLTDPGVDWPETLAGATQAKPEARVAADRIRVTFVNHATVLVQAGGLNILTDPIWAERASPVGFAGPKRHNPPGIAFDDLPPIDLVVVSHNHYDHMDTATLARLWNRDKPVIVAPLGNASVMRADAPGMQVRELDWDASTTVNGARVTVVPVQHWSSRWGIDRDLSLWGGYVIETPAGTVYFAGDTGYGDGGHFRRIAGKFGRVRLALLPIGAYEPRWFMAYQHENAQEAVQAAIDTCAEHAMGVHWGTFRLTNEAIMDPPLRVAEEVKRRGLPEGWFRTPLPGGSFEVPPEDRGPAQVCRQT